LGSPRRFGRLRPGDHLTSARRGATGAHADSIQVAASPPGGMTMTVSMPRAA
jgi:hypothetical protein